MNYIHSCNRLQLWLFSIHTLEMANCAHRLALAFAIALAHTYKDKGMRPLFVFIFHSVYETHWKIAPSDEPTTPNPYKMDLHVYSKRCCSAEKLSIRLKSCSLSNVRLNFKKKVYVFREKNQFLLRLPTRFSSAKTDFLNNFWIICYFNWVRKLWKFRSVIKKFLRNK